MMAFQRPHPRKGISRKHMTIAKIRPWRVLETREIYSAPPWIKLCRQKILLPNGREIDDYHKLELPDYAGVVAATTEGRIIFERLYKHGVGKVTLTLPGGAMDKDEAPLAAVQRELLEETGYVAEDWQGLGSFVCDGNYGCGRVHLFQATNARRIRDPQSGDLEEMEIVFLTPEEVLESLRGGLFAVLGVATAVALALHSGFIREPIKH